MRRYFRRNPEPDYSEQYKKMIEEGGFEVVFDFGPDGDFTSKIEGLSGPSCSHVQENFINDMGVALEHHATDDYFKPPPPSVAEEDDVIRLKPKSSVEAPIQKFKPTLTPKQSQIEKEKEKEKYRKARRLSRRNPADICDSCGYPGMIRSVSLSGNYASPKVKVCHNCAPWLF